MPRTNDLPALREALIAFRDARDWQQFHSLRNLIVSLNLEAAELLELTQWLRDEEVDALPADPVRRDALADECASLLNAPIDPEGALEIAKRSRGTPRIANRLLRRVRDYAEVKADGNIGRSVADQALHMRDVDPAGLDLMDRKLLSAVIDKFGGGPVGVDNLAAAIGEARDTIEDVLEP